MRNIFPTLIMVALLGFFTSSCNESATVPETAQAEKTTNTESTKKAGQSAVAVSEGEDANVLQVAMTYKDDEGNKPFSTLVAAVQAAGVEDALVNAGPLTVFVPLNSAFEKLPEGTVEMLVKPENKAKLGYILKNHVAPANYPEKQLKKEAKKGRKLYMASGKYLVVENKEGKVYAGGLQWMKSGNGITHDEFHTYDFQEKGGLFAGFQFWINLPAKQKAENAEYLAVQSEEVDEFILGDNDAVLRLLLGNFKDKTAKIPIYLDQFMYHVKLKPGKSIDMSLNSSWENAIYAVKGSFEINNEITLEEREIAEISNFNDKVNITNKSKETVGIILFGGESYTEQVVSYGPFIMNTQSEIAQAYREYNNGDYGKIDYSKVKI